MPIYLHLATLIIDKDVVKQKYKGGVTQFQIDYSTSSDNFHQEDHELFALAAMNIDEFNIEKLLDKGLDFNPELQTSNDFTIKPRYGECLWRVDWLEDNGIFAWHKDASADLIKKADEISHTSMDVIAKRNEEGENLFATIV